MFALCCEALSIQTNCRSKTLIWNLILNLVTSLQTYLDMLQPVVNDEVCSYASIIVVLISFVAAVLVRA